jgi:hypothetical protein
MKRYYSFFINIMAAIARDFNSVIIKNTGDSLIYYFPETSDSAKYVCVSLPMNINTKTAGPLFCGGITVFNPIIQNNIGLM